MHFCPLKFCEKPFLFLCVAIMCKKRLYKSLVACLQRLRLHKNVDSPLPTFHSPCPSSLSSWTGVRAPSFFGCEVVGLVFLESSVAGRWGITCKIPWGGPLRAPTGDPTGGPIGGPKGGPKGAATASPLPAPPPSPAGRGWGNPGTAATSGLAAGVASYFGRNPWLGAFLMLPLGIGDLVRRRFEGHGISSSSESLSVENAYNLMSFFLLDQSIKNALQRLFSLRRSFCK